MACHDVGKVSKGLRCVAFRSDVDVDSAASCCIASCSGFSQAADNLLQKLHVIVGQDRGDHLTFLAVASGDADVLLEFPFPSACIPCAPGLVAVASCGVLVSACSEEVGGKLGCLLAGDAVQHVLKVQDQADFLPSLVLY